MSWKEKIRVSLYPHIAFSGFHPDIRAFSYDGAPVPSPTWNLHSAIIMAAFANGIPARDVPDLFNAYVFAVLGFFDDTRGRGSSSSAKRGRMVTSLRRRSRSGGRRACSCTS